MIMFLRLTALIAILGSVFGEVTVGESKYGVDESWPMMHSSWKPLSDERRTTYENFMNGCRESYMNRPGLCDDNEQQRLDMTLRQPQSMVNYTETGYMKIQAPEALRTLLTEHWERNKDDRTEERWGAANIYTNHWEAPTYMVSVEDVNLRGGGIKLKQQVWDAARDTLERWTGMELEPVSQYGIRVYTEGAILSPHVDRLPLVSSCIVNVAQDVDEPWPLEIFDREGNAVNVTMEPGDMVLYESGSLIHGRPFPLKGRYFANIFIHFEPTGRHVYHRKDDPVKANEDGLAPYIIPGSLEEPHWWRSNPDGWKMESPSAAQVDTLEGHQAAQSGDIETLKRMAQENSRLLHDKDRNGWMPIHEAARAGHADIVELLVEKGADINARTHHGNGISPLNLALRSNGRDHPVTQYLIKLGAVDIGPEL